MAGSNSWGEKNNEHNPKAVEEEGHDPGSDDQQKAGETGTSPLIKSE